MREVIFVAILLATDATAGEIVWRSPTTGTLTAIADPAPTQPEPEQPAFGIRYEPIQVAAGTSISVTPIGDTRGYVFGAQNPLPPGLTLDTATGKIAGFAAVVGNYSVTIRAEKDGSYSDLVTSISIS